MTVNSEKCVIVTQTTLPRRLALLCCIGYLIPFSTSQIQNESPLYENKTFHMELEEIMQAAEAIVMKHEEMRLNAAPDKGCPFQDNSLSMRHHKPYKDNSKSHKIDKRQAKYEEMAKIFKERNYTYEKIDIARNKAIQCAEEEQLCDASAPYRTYDGACNNLENPNFGRAYTCYKRLMKPFYADGISEIRKAKSGKNLPTPRDVSIVIHGFSIEYDLKHSHMLMEYGEFLIADFLTTSAPTKADGSPIQCCSKKHDPLCGDLKIRKDDPFFAAFNVTCVPNSRNLRCDTCSFGPRIQINAESAYVDASLIYGATKEDADELRTYMKGQLLSYQDKNHGELMPRIPYNTANSTCKKNKQGKCFHCGNTNCNLHPGLASLITAFLRLHNKIALELTQLNPHWNDEKTYQETRRILGAISQCLTYKEFVPLLIGPEAMEQYKLQVGEDTGYNTDVDAGIFIEFVSVAYRLGHTLIAQFAEVHDNGGIDFFELRDYNTDTSGFYHGQFPRLTKGLLISPCSKFDRYLIKDVTNHLNEIRGQSCFGSDLAAVDIFRGRDQGVPPYVEAVKFANGPHIKTFVDLENLGLFPKGLTKIFESVYESVEDVDFITGAISELPCPGCIVSTTIMKVLAIQFQRLKYGDRFFFEHADQPTSFTTAQRNELRKVTLANILCNIDIGLEATQKNVFLLPSDKNPIVPCRKGSVMDLKHWKAMRDL